MPGQTLNSISDPARPPPPAVPQQVSHRLPNPRPKAQETPARQHPLQHVPLRVPGRRQRHRTLRPRRRKRDQPPRRQLREKRTRRHVLQNPVSVRQFQRTQSYRESCQRLAGENSESDARISESSEAPIRRPCTCSASLMAASMAENRGGVRPLTNRPAPALQTGRRINRKSDRSARPPQLRQSCSRPEIEW